MEEVWGSGHRFRKKSKIRKRKSSIIYHQSARRRCDRGYGASGQRAVIAPGEVIASILPSDGLHLIEGRVRPQDRDQITVGQPTELRVAAAYRSDTPTFDGKIDEISADRLVDEATGEAYFRVSVGALRQREFKSSFQNDNWAVKLIRVPAAWMGLEIAQPSTVKEKSAPFDLQPGMTVDVFIQTKSRRAINYFIKPLTDALSKAFK